MWWHGLDSLMWDEATPTASWIDLAPTPTYPSARMGQSPGTNHPTNGLLRRADLHTLFDFGLISVDAHTMTGLVSSRLSASEYATLHGHPLRASLAGALAPRGPAASPCLGWPVALPRAKAANDLPASGGDG